MGLVWGSRVIVPLARLSGVLSFISCSGLGCDVGGRSEACKQEVTLTHGFIEVTCPQRHADTLLLISGQMQREMTPPSAVVVPKVVEGIGCVDTDG